MENENKTGTETGTENTTGTETQVETAKKPPLDSTVELEALKEMYDEQSKTLESAMKEIKELKVANAKMALTQSYKPVETPEEILDKMFK